MLPADEGSDTGGPGGTRRRCGVDRDVSSGAGAGGNLGIQTRSRKRKASVMSRDSKRLVGNAEDSKLECEVSQRISMELDNLRSQLDEDVKEKLRVVMDLKDKEIRCLRKQIEEIQAKYDKHDEELKAQYEKQHEELDAMYEKKYQVLKSKYEKQNEKLQGNYENHNKELEANYEKLQSKYEEQKEELQAKCKELTNDLHAKYEKSEELQFKYGKQTKELQTKYQELQYKYEKPKEKRYEEQTKELQAMYEKQNEKLLAKYIEAERRAAVAEGCLQDQVMRNEGLVGELTQARADFQRESDAHNSLRIAAQFVLDNLQVPPVVEATTMVPTVMGIIERARALEDESFLSGIHQTLTIARSHYPHFDSKRMSHGFAPHCTDAELDEIEEQVAPFAQMLAKGLKAYAQKMAKGLKVTKADTPHEED